jgi:hypothetical protein
MPDNYEGAFYGFVKQYHAKNKHQLWESQEGRGRFQNPESRFPSKPSLWTSICKSFVFIDIFSEALWEFGVSKTLSGLRKQLSGYQKRLSGDEKQNHGISKTPFRGNRNRYSGYWKHYAQVKHCFRFMNLSYPQA